MDEQAIRAQLDRIFASPGFIHSERLRRLLSFLVDESLPGRADTLHGHRLGVEVFARGADFDPQTDSLVRNHVSRPRHALAIYFLAEDRADAVRNIAD